MRGAPATIYDLSLGRTENLEPPCILVAATWMSKRGWKCVYGFSAEVVM